LIVGVCRLVLALPGVDSLKGKRSIVRRIVDRVRHRFNAAVAEVDALDSHRRAVLGFAVVSNDGRHANAMIDEVVSHVAAASEAVLVDRTTELVHMDGSMGMLGSEGWQGQALGDPDHGEDDDGE